jgi:hypothetical protein
VAELLQVVLYLPLHHLSAFHFLSLEDPRVVGTSCISSEIEHDERFLPWINFRNVQVINLPLVELWVHKFQPYLHLRLYYSMAAFSTNLKLDFH